MERPHRQLDYSTAVKVIYFCVSLPQRLKDVNVFWKVIKVNS